MQVILNAKVLEGKKDKKEFKKGFRRSRFELRKEKEDRQLGKFIPRPGLKVQALAVKPTAKA